MYKKSPAAKQTEIQSHRTDLISRRLGSVTGTAWPLAGSDDLSLERFFLPLISCGLDPDATATRLTI
jgi:hypothetical protein